MAGWAAIVQEVARDHADTARSAVRQTSNRAVALEQYVARTLEAADLVIHHVGDKYLRSGGLDGAGRSPARLSDAVIDRRSILSVHIVDPNGNLVASTAPATGRINLADHPLFLAHQKIPGERLMISPPLPSRFVPGRYVFLSRRVQDSAGATLGYVAVQIEPEQLSNFVGNVFFKPTDLVSVIGLDGITRARREGRVTSYGQDLRGKLVMRMQFRNPNGTYVGPSSLDGHVRYFTHRRLKDYPIFVTAGVSREGLIAPVRKRARFYYGAMIALTFGAILLAGLITASLLRRHRRASEVEEANKRLRIAQRVAKIGNWEYDVRSQTLSASDQLCEMYERDPADDRLTLPMLCSYLDDDGRTTLRQAFERAVLTGEPQSYEYKAYLPSGAVRHRAIVAVPVMEGSTVAALHGTDQDVTADKLLHSLQGQVAHLARMDAMNAMAATLAHELNQPLTAAANYLAGGERLLALERQGVGNNRDGSVGEAIRSAKHQVHVAGQIIRKVRNMVGSRATAIAPASLDGVIREALILLRTTNICSNITVTTEVSPNADHVWADEIQTQQVLLNLIRNACEAVAEAEQPSVKIMTEPHEGGFVLISVEDNGGGISVPVSELFSPFDSDKAEGLGLGLSISRTIVEYHGGRIWVEETGPAGTRMSFTLPGSPDAKPQVDPMHEVL